MPPVGEPRCSPGVDAGTPHPYKRLFLKSRLVVMANTKSAKKATRQIARRTAINKSRRSRMRTALRKVEEAISAGDRAGALAAMATAEPALVRAARKCVLHRNAAQRKVSRLTRGIAKLAK